MKLEEIGRVAVVGAGTMGHGIAQLAAMAGYGVRLYDISEEIVRQGYQKIQWSLEKLSQKGVVDREQLAPTLERITPLTDLEAASQAADVVIEAAPENLSLKRELFGKLDRLAPDSAILATNTSSLPISDIAEATARPDRVVGMHFFNPPVLMALVEVVRGKETSDETVDLAVGLSKRLKKTPVVCRKDVRGFITSSIFEGFMGEAMWQATREGTPIRAIDATLKHVEKFPMGPFELADLTGLDVSFNIRREAGLPIPPILERKVESGALGRKSGAGFYDYESGSGPDYGPEDAHDFDPLPLHAMMASIAAQLVQDDVADPPDIDLAMRLGGGFPKGPLAKAEELGLQTIVEKLDEMRARYQDERYEVPQLLRRKAERDERFHS